MFLLQNCPRDAKPAAKVAAKAGMMEQFSSSNLELDEIDGTSNLVVSTIALMMAGEGDSSLRQAKVACHQFPHLAESWAVLAAAARIKGSSSSTTQWLKNVVEHVKKLGHEGVLAEWAGRVSDSL